MRNQQNCGACWAISVIEMIESVYAIKTGSLQIFSVQEVNIHLSYLIKCMVVLVKNKKLSIFI